MYVDGNIVYVDGNNVYPDGNFVFDYTDQTERSDAPLLSQKSKAPVSVDKKMAQQLREFTVSSSQQPIAGPPTSQVNMAGPSHSVATSSSATTEGSRCVWFRLYLIKITL